MQFETCEACGKEVGIGAWPWCPHGRAFAHVPFHEYEVDLGSGGVHRITSLQDAQRLERQTEQAYRNGDRDKGGKLVAPVVLRAFHQDKSNLDTPVWDPPRYRKPDLGIGNVGGPGDPRRRE